VKVLLASHNPGKLRELRALLRGWEIEPADVSAIGEETGSTFRANARAKAAYALAGAPPDAWALGEDSGLEVAGLDGRPGLYSARYAGPEATDADNVARLLEELRDVRGDGRRARYVCELVLLPAQGEETAGRGTLEGTIAPEPRGSGGFGYDPVFVPAGESETVAELGDAWKAEHSHRARAARALVRALSRRPA
jgi:XTP/dITP diphosphohydrolase